MLLIRKGPEPNALTEYRTRKWNPLEKQSLQPTYADMPTEIKDEIRKYLLREQGCLCAYCMRRLDSIEKVKVVKEKAANRFIIARFSSITR